MENKFKRFLSMALVLMMIFAMLPLSATAAENILTIQGESGTMSNGAAAVSNDAASGGAHAGNIGGATDGTVTFDVVVSNAGPATLNLYYIQADNRSFEVDVNGTVYTVQAPSSGSWTVPGETPVTLEVTLNAGSNTVAVSGVGTAYAPNLDYIEIIMTTARYEMEAGVLNGCAIVDEASCSGGKRVGNIGNGSTVTHIVNVSSAGAASLAICYGQADARPLEVTVNGTTYTLACSNTGSWNGCSGIVTLDVTLKAGSNTIVFGRADAFAPNLDYFDITTSAGLITSATLVAGDVTVQAGSQVKVPVYLKDAQNLIGVGDGTIGGFQFKVTTNDTMTLTGFEAGTLFADFDWSTSNGRVLGFSPLSASGVSLSSITDDTVIGYLVYSTTSAFKTSEISIEVETLCDNAESGIAMDYTNYIVSEASTITKAAEKAVLTGGNVTVEAGAQAKVPVYLTNADALLDTADTDGTLGGVQFKVSYNVALALTGFELSDLFASYDVGTSAYDDNSARILITNMSLSNDPVAVSSIADDTVIGYLVFNTGSALETSEVTIAVESVCDEQGNDYTAAVNAGSFTVTTEEPALAAWDLAFTNMTLGNNLAMSFAFEQSHVEDWTDYYVVIEKSYADGRENAVKTVAYEDWSVANINGAAHYYVTFDGIAAKEMADDVYVTVYNADDEAVSNVYTDSVRAYAMRNLSETATAEKDIVIIDMLNYGAASQEYLGYNTGDLANNQLSQTQKDQATADTTYSDYRVAGTNYFASNLKVESSILLQVAFKNVDQSMSAVISYTDHYGRAQSVTVDGSQFTQTGSYQIVTVDQLVVADARQLVTVQVYDGDTLVAEASDSVESYVARLSGSGAAVFEMLMKFSDSAYSFFH